MSFYINLWESVKYNFFNIKMDLDVIMYHFSEFVDIDKIINLEKYDIISKDVAYDIIKQKMKTSVDTVGKSSFENFIMNYAIESSRWVDGDTSERIIFNLFNIFLNENRKYLNLKDENGNIIEQYVDTEEEKWKYKGGDNDDDNDYKSEFMKISDKELVYDSKKMKWKLKC